MYKIDWKFITELEGFSPHGYVPKDEKNDRISSGVTIGSGFDIGQFSKVGLDLFGFSKELRKQLEPYTGLTGDKAREFLLKNPLTLSDGYLAELERVSREKLTEGIAKEYDQFTTSLKFKELSSPKQTVVASVGFQYGSLRRRCPRFFKCITEGRWGDAVKELENFGDAYRTRRRKEANLLRKEIV